MNYLLDTHIFLWFIDGDKKLSSEFRQIIESGKNVKFLSVASVWEILIKAKLDKLPNLTVPVGSILEQVESFRALDIKLPHVLEIGKLPNIHKDPFDRILIAQAKVENLILLTTD